MAPRARRCAALLVLTALLVAVAAPAQARGRPWPGHPDRRLVDHVVRPGETATGLATRYHAWTRELIRLNHLGRDARIRVGQHLRIPVVLSALPRHRRPTATPTPAPTPAPPAPARPTTVSHHGWHHWRMSREQVQRAIAREAARRGVPVRLAQAVAWQESGWHQPVRSPAGALGVMQVLPATGLWMSLYAGRPLDLRDTYDNITAGVTLLRVLLDETRSTRRAVAAYYQGLGAVRRHGIYPSTRPYVASVLAIRERLGRAAG
jgi:murein DD-endopeptidase MepM/ murein hydrolase activator NlpD